MNRTIIVIVFLIISLSMVLNRPVHTQRELYPTANWRIVDLVLIYRMWFDPEVKRLAEEIKRNEEIYRDAD